MKYLKTFESYEETKGTSDEGRSVRTIWGLLLDSRDSGWYGEQLQETTECVRTENGWLDILTEQYSNDPSISAVLKMIDENRFDLWEGNLESTFDCVLTEDLHEDGESKYTKGDLKVKYNGWMEKLEELI